MIRCSCLFQYPRASNGDTHTSTCRDAAHSLTFLRKIGPTSPSKESEVLYTSRHYIALLDPIISHPAQLPNQLA